MFYFHFVLHFSTSCFVSNIADHWLRKSHIGENKQIEINVHCMNKLHFQIRKYGDLKIIKGKLSIYPVFEKLFSYQIFLYKQFEHNIIT